MKGSFEGIKGHIVGRMTKSRRGKIYIDDEGWGPDAGSIEYGYRVLGNVVISKNFLRTRKIMVMHSNERGECCLRTLVDRKRKRLSTRLM